MKFSLFALLLIAAIAVIPAVPNATAQSPKSSGPDSSKTNRSFRPTKTQIKSAQEKLSSNGSYGGAVDGKYNNEFRASLRAYQETNGLERNGKLDEATISKMGISLTDRQKGIEPTKKSKRVVFRVSKDQVSEAQTKLKSQGLYDGEATGKYSKEFRASIREYQSANGLKRKGSLNRATLEKLGIALTEKQKAIPVNPKDIASKSDGRKKRGPVFRATKTQISSVQTMLRSKGLYSGESTGKLNPETRAGIRKWQDSNGVKVTGTLNKVTLEAMGIELTERQRGV